MHWRPGCPNPGCATSIPADSGAPPRGQLARHSVRLYPALETTFDERGAATLCASQHAHVAGSTVAPGDGQALVLD
jgi:hypothetical protein